MKRRGRVIFRTDASLDIGTGHVMRCLVLAESLEERGMDVSFICRELPGNLNDAIEGERYRLHRLPHKNGSVVTQQVDSIQTGRILAEYGLGIDWLIVDHYGLGLKWERAARPYASRVMVIDDSGHRHHDCELLLDQNLCPGMSARYKDAVPPGCKKLIGPRYALLRKEFYRAKKKAVVRRAPVKRMIVFFGGSDRSNQTSKALHAITILGRPDIFVNVVIGVNNRHSRSIEAFRRLLPHLTCHRNVNNFAEMMVNADIFIGAGGITTWERCCLGLPSLVVTVAKNQVETVKYMDKKNILFFLGEAGKVSASGIRDALIRLLAHPGLLAGYSRKSMACVDGFGAQRCADELIGINPTG